MIKFIKNDQFKTIRFSFQFVDIVEKDAYGYRFLLSELLHSYTDRLNSVKEFNRYLAALYGSRIDSGVFSLEANHIISFNGIIADPKFILDDNLFSNMVLFLEEVLFKRDLFDHDLFNDIKQDCIKFVNQIKDQRFDYAKSQFEKYLYFGTDFAHPEYGTVEELSAITKESLYDYYKRYFLNNGLVLVVNGNLSSSQEQLVLDTFGKYDNKNVVVNRAANSLLPNYHEHFELTNNGQALLFLGYSLPVKIDDPLFFAAKIVSLLIGGYPESYLFRVFREELSLGYDIDCYYSNSHSCMIVYAGVSSADYKESLAVLINLIDKIIAEGFSKEQLDSAKRFLKTSYIASLDDQDRQSFLVFLSGIYNKDYGIDFYVNGVDAVSVSDLLDCLSVLELKVVYALHGGSNEDEIF